MTDKASGAADTTGHGLLCPACRIDLVMSDRQGIEIDYCPKCRGVWLDRGELDKIIERNANAEAQGAPAQNYPPQDRYYGDRYGGHGGGHHGRGGRRSFLRDLFD